MRERMTGARPAPGFGPREAAPQWWRAAIAEFGAGLGFRDTRDWTADVLNLSVEDGRYLVDVERSGDAVVLAVLRRAPLPDIEDHARALLAACGFERDHPFFLQAGLKGEDVLVLAARLSRAESRGLYGAFELIRQVYAELGL